jgi:hypothetical protein
MQQLSQNFDINHLNHFNIWLIFGIIYPNNYILAFIISIIWEIFEILIVRIKPLYKLTKKYWIVSERYWNETKINKIVDIICNMTGYFFGSHIRFYLRKVDSNN